MCRMIQTGIDDKLDYIYSVDSGHYEPAVGFELVQKINQLKSKFRENYKSYSITRAEYEDTILSRHQTDNNMRYHFSEGMITADDFNEFKYPNKLITEQTADYLADDLDELNELAENDYGRLELDHYFFGDGFLGRQWTLSQYLDYRCY